MNLGPLLSAIDQKPFRPFVISLTSGERFEVAHPDNIFLLPSREKVHHIEIYRSETEFTIIYPEVLATLQLNGERKSLS